MSIESSKCTNSYISFLFRPPSTMSRPLNLFNLNLIKTNLFYRFIYSFGPNQLPVCLICSLSLSILLSVIITIHEGIVHCRPMIGVFQLNVIIVIIRVNDSFTHHHISYICLVFFLCCRVPTSFALDIKRPFFISCFFWSKFVPLPLISDPSRANKMNNNRIKNEEKLNRKKNTKQLSLLRGEPTVTKLKCVIFKDNLLLLIRKKRQKTEEKKKRRKT